MTVRLEDTRRIDASPEAVWSFIADPGNRARAISTVRRFEVHGGPDRHTTWWIELPIRLLGTITVETRERERREPEFVEFVGHSRAFEVVGNHRIEGRDGGTTFSSTFEVNGKLPGVERVFERQFPQELENVANAIEAHLDRTEDLPAGTVGSSDGAANDSTDGPSDGSVESADGDNPADSTDDNAVESGESTDDNAVDSTGSTDDRSVDSARSTDAPESIDSATAAGSPGVSAHGADRGSGCSSEKGRFGPSRCPETVREDGRGVGRVDR